MIDILLQTLVTQLLILGLGFLIVTIGCLLVLFYLTVVEKTRSRVKMGKVVSKYYTPAGMVLSSVPLGLGSITTAYPSHLYFAERFEVVIGRTSKGKFRTNTITLSKEDFDKVNEGDFVVVRNKELFVT